MDATGGDEATDDVSDVEAEVAPKKRRNKAAKASQMWASGLQLGACIQPTVVLKHDKCNDTGSRHHAWSSTFLQNGTRQTSGTFWKGLSCYRPEVSNL